MNYPWNHHRRYNDFPTHFKQMFDGQRVQKVSIDAGFTCPNRDGKLAKNGCAYCNNKTFKPDYCRIEETITEQVEKGIQFFTQKYQSMQFLGYFQAYTNTYASLDVLRQKYEEALQHEKIIGLVIGTRPDCLASELLDYLEELAQHYYIMVEFGIESTNDRTLQRINRGHDYATAVRAIEETTKRGIHNCGHLILGLPGETRKDFLNQACEISKLPIENIKLHQLQIHRGTQLAKDYANNPDEFNLFSLEDYLELCVDYLELLHPRIIVERFISQSPKDMLIAPKWGVKNFEFVAKLEKRLEERDTWQGKHFEL
ncbi:MAG: TIGR01212 family radical SAM protein [Mangrovibacterium sp.]